MLGRSFISFLSERNTSLKFHKSTAGLDAAQEHRGVKSKQHQLGGIRQHEKSRSSADHLCPGCSGVALLPWGVDTTLPSFTAVKRMHANYCLDIVAWGGMLFVLLCGAAPAMCSQDTSANDSDGRNDIRSPRRRWTEINSQIIMAYSA